MIGDGTVHYDHDFDGTSQEAGGCQIEFRNRQSPSTARVRYILGTLSVNPLPFSNFLQNNDVRWIY